MIASTLKNTFSPSQIEGILTFQDLKYDESNKYFIDPGFLNFLDKIVFNILLKEDYELIMEEVKNENIFYQAFYLAYKFIGRDFQGFKDLKYFEFAQNYLHLNELYNHYFVLDHFLDVY